MSARLVEISQRFQPIFQNVPCPFRAKPRRRWPRGCRPRGIWVAPCKPPRSPCRSMPRRPEKQMTFSSFEHRIRKFGISIIVPDHLKRPPMFFAYVMHCVISSNIRQTCWVRNTRTYISSREKHEMTNIDMSHIRGHLISYEDLFCHWHPSRRITQN